MLVMLLQVYLPAPALPGKIQVVNYKTLPVQLQQIVEHQRHLCGHSHMKMTVGYHQLQLLH